MLMPAVGRADRREFYTTVDIAPIYMHLDEPIRGGPKTNCVGAEASLSAYYGLTNSFHLGGSLHYAMAKDAKFDNVSLLLPDGTPSSGAVFEDVTAFSATGLLAYRLNLGRPFTTVAQVEAGLVSLAYGNIGHVPQGTNYSIGFPKESETRLELRASLRGDYRFGEHFLVGAGLGIVAHPGAMNSWSVIVPVTVGWIW